MSSKRITLAVIVVGIVGAGSFFVFANDAEESEIQINEDAVVDMSAIPDNLTEIVTQAITRQSNENVVILDVRSDEEWNESHAAGAVHWGLEEHIEAGEMPNIDKDNEIYVYCRSGRRATIAIQLMQQAGFTNLTNIRGLEDWQAAGGDIIVGADDEQ